MDPYLSSAGPWCPMALHARNKAFFVSKKQKTHNQQTTVTGPEMGPNTCRINPDGFLKSSMADAVFRGAGSPSVYSPLLTKLLLPVSRLCVLMGWEWSRASSPHPSPGQLHWLRWPPVPQAPARAPWGRWQGAMCIDVPRSWQETGGRKVLINSYLLPPWRRMEIKVSARTSVL